MTAANPYAAPARAERPRPPESLPEGRLAALGVTEPVLAWLRSTWAKATSDDRRAARANLDAESDAGIVEWLVGGMPPDGSVRDITTWASTSANPQQAALLAARVERAQPEPRKSLLAALDRLAG